MMQTNEDINVLLQSLSLKINYHLRQVRFYNRYYSDSGQDKFFSD